MGSSPPNSLLLRQANVTFNSQVVSGNLLDTPARRYAKNLTHTSEQLAAQVAILRKENKDQKAILYKRRKQSGKRAVVKGHFMLSTAEIRDNIQEMEKETVRKKATQPTTRKRKRQETPPEDEEEYMESSSDSNLSDMSDCIVVTQC
ncbi:hypothetical protein GP486_008707 [Trichoglossum hirsutum]|uniref:Uncharacterized protein n=1 Tax=Trichoglossum hirsutum TaxID=265104 RepID=A0A9P8I8H2_9PEZI|nr:hypothetical protein GP486_008707 [Trichoglossum hirsutum]